MAPVMEDLLSDAGDSEVSDNAISARHNERSN